MENVHQPAVEKDSVASYVDGVKWLVGLSVGAVGGVFLHYEQIVKQPHWVRVTLGADVGLFLLSILGGVHYLLWINAVRTHKDRIAEIESKLPGTPDSLEKTEMEGKRDESKAKLKSAAKNMPSWHLAY